MLLPMLLLYAPTLRLSNISEKLAVTNHPSNTVFQTGATNSLGMLLDAISLKLCTIGLG